MFCTKLREAIRNGARATARALIKRMNLHEQTPMPTWTIAQTVDWMVPMALAGKSLRCPCCNQNVHVYYRHLNGPMARTLIHMYYYDCAHPGEWMHVDNYLVEAGIKNSRYYSLMLFWRLIEHAEARRDDDNPRSGLWRISERGRQFVQELRREPEAFWMYNDENYGFADDTVDIRAALRSGAFLYHDIMRPLFPQLNVVPSPEDLAFVAQQEEKARLREEKEARKREREAKMQCA